MPYTKEQLTAAGGKTWEKGGMRRVYFNSLAERFGLKTSHYNTGNISSATLDGESISNCRAREIVLCLVNGKVWYDFADDKFHGKFDSCRDYSSNDFFQFFVKSIKSDLDKLTAANAA